MRYRLYLHLRRQGVHPFNSVEFKTEDYNKTLDEAIDSIAEDVRSWVRENIEVDLESYYDEGGVIEDDPTDIAESV